MKQCPTCGHRTNDDVCPVCGAATVVLQNDPQEKAQRTIQYQRFDPSKAPGATASGQTVQTGHRYIQKDPGATHQMQQGAGMTPPQRNQQPHPANQPPLRVGEMQTSSKLQKPQSELSRKMQTVPGISLTSIRMFPPDHFAKALAEIQTKIRNIYAGRANRGRSGGLRDSDGASRFKAIGLGGSGKDSRSTAGRRDQCKDSGRNRASASSASRSCETSSGRSGGLRNSGGGRRPTHSAGKTNYGRSCSRI